MSETIQASFFTKLKQTSIDQILLILLAFLLPFDRFPTYKVADFDIKLSTFVGAVVILLAAFRLVTKQVNLRRFLPLGILLAWFAWLLLGGLWARDLSLFLKAVLPLSFLTMLSISIAMLWRPEYKRPVLKTLLLGAAVSIGFGIFQFIGNFVGLPDVVTLIRPEYSWQGFGFPRLHSFSLEPLYFAGYLLLPIAVLLAWILKNKKLTSKSWAPAIFAFTALSTVVLTLSRGALMALFVMGATLAILFRKELISLLSWRFVVGVGIGFIVSFAAVLGLVAVFNRQGNDSDLTYGTRGISTFISHLGNTRFFANQDNKEKDDSIAQRDTARQQGIELIGSDKLILLRGVGAGQYELYANERNAGQFKGEPNNMIIEQIVQTGLIGLTLLVAFFYTLLRMLYKEYPQNWLAAALFAYIVAIIVQAQTFHGLSITHLWFAVGLALAQLKTKNVGR